jgi:Kef-type K+ transport system membrane component KefB
LSKFFSKINTGIGMKFTFAISLCLVFAYLADRVDLALIVGAFAAGLILEPIHFRYFQEPEIIEEIQKDLTNAPQSVRDKIADTIRQHADHHLNILIEPIAFLLVPIFFVVTGMQVDLSTLADPNILIAGVVITALAFIGKIAAGLFGGNNIHSMLVVGFGMIPRGEVALIFATIGKGLGVLSDEVFSVVIIMTILTTFPIPPILTYLLKMNKGSAIKVTEGSN